MFGSLLLQDPLGSGLDACNGAGLYFTECLRTNDLYFLAVIAVAAVVISVVVLRKFAPHCVHTQH